MPDRASLAEAAGLDEPERAVVYYTALLVNVGCHTDAHEQAKWFGDDIALKAGKYEHRLGSLRGTAAGMRRLGAGRPPLRRFRVGLEFALSGHREVDQMIAQHARIARSLGEQLELPDGVLVALAAAYEMWDGSGWPGELKGEAIPIASRIAQLAEFVEVAHRSGGIEAATRLARTRSGSQFDPRLADRLCADAERDPRRARRAADLAGGDRARAGTRDRPLRRSLRRRAARDRELRRPQVPVHARPCARGRRPGAEAASLLGLSEGEIRTVRRAALVHDFGRLGVSNAIWDKAGPLGLGEWERVRMHPYLTERMLQQSATLAPLGRIAVQHRERLDGSGYPRGLRGGEISRPARILAAADAYQAMREPRPHRPALSATDAAAQVRADVRAGRLDAEITESVLSAAGHRVRRRRDGPAGLTAREIEVLVLLARGLSNKAIAEQLVISPKTAGKHVEHIYAKIDASSRAAAGLFAMQPRAAPGRGAAGQSLKRCSTCSAARKSRIRRLTSSGFSIGTACEVPGTTAS